MNNSCREWSIWASSFKSKIQTKQHIIIFKVPLRKTSSPFILLVELNTCIWAGHPSGWRPEGEEVPWCQIPDFPWALWAAAISSFNHGPSFGVRLWFRTSWWCDASHEKDCFDGPYMFGGNCYIHICDFQ